MPDGQLERPDRRARRTPIGNLSLWPFEGRPVDDRWAYALTAT